MSSVITCSWKERVNTRVFRSGVSLHSHTNQSKETLNFIAAMGNKIPWLEKFVRSREEKCAGEYGLKLDFDRAYWTPPLTPMQSLDLERGQIENGLQLSGMVSISDHDDINAPLLLRATNAAEDLPISVEWSAPFGITTFHLGIHNLPAGTCQQWMSRMEALTATPNEQELRSILAELHEIKQVLIIFNHPLWDLYDIGAERHLIEVERFLRDCGGFVHALELNGLRNWHENRDVIALAGRWGMLLISGGDRHGTEPNANVNLTRAASFAEFVQEVRVERVSHVHFMPQYAEPWKHRVLESTLAAIRNYPEFPEGSRRWDERVFHPDANGVMQPVSAMWQKGRAPWYIGASLTAVRMMGSAPFWHGLRMAWSEAEPEFKLAE